MLTYCLYAMEHRNLTVLFTDMKGFTSRTSAQSRTATAAMIKQHKDLLIPVIQKRGGTLIKSIGDAFLSTFESPTDAVLTGMAIQDALQERNLTAPIEEQIQVRVTINTGEVILEEGDVYGEAVNIAAHLQAGVEPREVYFTESTYLSMNKAEVVCEEVGYREIKGIPEKLRIYKVAKASKVTPFHVAASAASRIPRKSPRIPSRGTKKKLLLGAGAVLVTAIVFAVIGQQAELKQARVAQEQARIDEADRLAELQTEITRGVEPFREEIELFYQNIEKGVERLESWETRLTAAVGTFDAIDADLAQIGDRMGSIHQSYTERLSHMIEVSHQNGNPSRAADYENELERFEKALARIEEKYHRWLPEHQAGAHEAGQWVEQIGDGWNRIDAFRADLEEGTQALDRIEQDLPDDWKTQLAGVAEGLRRFHGGWTQFDKRLTHRQARLDRWTNEMEQSKNTLREFKTFVDQTQSRMASR